ncbi:uncharacterized protein LOC118480158 [Helianthus annuus]|uniref:uncharacterized protein LOC118480158 n=1 Tax=Helianthus annuus TaxID=4232 RepID=UPI001652BBCB|nr:uncharacterized protein LOC118480158 [Helianthus annuus]
MGDGFLNPFSDVFAYNTGDASTNTTTNTNPNPKKVIADSLSVDNAYGTYNKPPKLMAIEDYNRWADRFDGWLKAFAYLSWRCMKNGYDIGRKDYENLAENEQETFIGEQKCVALLHQSVRDDIISLIRYDNSKDLWLKLEKKCIGGEEIVKNKRRLLKKEFDLFSCMKNETLLKMIERFCHLKIELVRHGITITEEEMVEKLLESFPYEKDWQYYGLVLKNTKAMSEMTVDWLIERFESRELEIRKMNKVNNTPYQQNVDLYYRGSMIPKTNSPKTAFSAENSNTVTQEKQSSSSLPSSGYHVGSSSPVPGNHQQQNVPKNDFQCNIAVNLNNAQNFNEETAKQQMVFLASILESYESFDWSEFLPEDDEVGFAFMAQIHPEKDIRTEEQKYNYQKLIALNMRDKIYVDWKEAKKANRWDPDQEYYLDPKESLKQEDEQRERERDVAKKAEEEELKSKKIDEGIIDTTKEMTTENLTKMADKVLMAKELEVDSKSASESTSKVKKWQINQQLDEIANLKLQFQEAKIENERINLKLNSYNSAGFVLQHIVPKPIGKNKVGEDVYSDGTGELPRSISRWIMDSGASRHMTGREALLYDVRGFNSGYVGFVGNQGGSNIGEGTLSNGVITFERVNYIAELENNLLSISQICDRMYSTHFTDKECLILKLGFVIPEEWIIMRAPRVNDLYVLDMSVATTTTGQP